MGKHDLRRHIRDARGLDIAYRDGAGTRSTRRILPVALIYYVDSVVLAGWCDLRNDFRHFRIDRLESCIPDGTRFESRGALLRRRWRETREQERA